MIKLIQNNPQPMKKYRFDQLNKVWQHVYEMIKNNQQFNLPVMLKWD